MKVNGKPDNLFETTLLWTIYIFVGCLYIGLVVLIGKLIIEALT